MPERLTLQDIATAAGVSKATVSRVLGAHPELYDVDAVTRAKVRRAAEALGWQGPAPRKERPEESLAMIYEATGMSPGEGFAEPLAQAARAVGVALTYEPMTRPVEAWRQRLEHHLRPSGALIVSPLPLDLQALAGLHFPAVVVNQRTTLQLPHVIPDDVVAGELLGRRLVQFGHRRVVWLAPPEHFHFSVGDRAQGLRQAGLELVPYSGDVAEDIIEQLRFRRAGQPTALVAWTWYAAIEALFACHRYELQVPQNLSVVAFDDHHLAATSHPPLTVVSPRHDLVAAEAIRLVRSGERAPGERLTPVSLFARLSDGPASSS